jgi:hypothetical protein
LCPFCWDLIELECAPPPLPDETAEKLREFMDSPPRGERVNIIADDLAADCPPVTPEQRAKIRDLFDDWMATAAPDGTFAVIESRPPWWHLPRWLGLWRRKWRWRRARRRAANKRRRDR